MHIDTTTARNIISTLKSGVIPSTGSEFISTGRDRALKEFDTASILLQKVAA